MKDILDKYNNDKRFLCYPWYVRRNLILTIKEYDFDYCYVDTDSVKYKNLGVHNGNTNG